jgi:creatinine amidohydrolase
MKLIIFLSISVLILSCYKQNELTTKDITEKVLYEELTPNEFRDRISEAPVAYLPLGTMEWHGEHLPLGADGLQSKGFFEILAREAGGIVYPMLFLGPGRMEIIDGKEYYGMDLGPYDTTMWNYPRQQLEGSSYWISDEGFTTMMEAILKQISHSGFKILVAHGHGPSTSFVIDHTDVWEQKYGLKILHCWGDRDNTGMGIMTDHAAMNETSLLMTLRPELVKMEHLPADTAVVPVGIGGRDPRIWASPEIGAEILATQKERMINLIRETLAGIR